MVILQHSAETRGITTTYTYFADGRLELREYPSITQQVEFYYDAVGNRTVMIDHNSSYSYFYTYDPLNQLESAKNAAGTIVTSTYDAAGQRKTMIDIDGGVFTYTYTYDDAGQNDTTINPEGERTTCTFDDAGRVTQKDLGNGTYASMSYDAADRLLILENRKSDNSTISSFSYTYDKVDNPKEVLEDTGDTVAWDYDANYRLKNATRIDSDPLVAYNTTMTYDAVGNRVTMTLDGTATDYTFNGANEMTLSEVAGAKTTYTYDAAGNQTSSETPAGAVTTNVWDDEGLRSRVILPNGVISTTIYNGDAQLVEKQHGAAEAVRFVYNINELLDETDASDVTQVLYTCAPQVGLISRTTDVSDFFHYDGSGSTRDFTDTLEVVVHTLIYDESGNIVYDSSGSSNEMCLWKALSGYHYDWDFGQYYEIGQVYEPIQWRFISPIRSPLQVLQINPRPTPPVQGLYTYATQRVAAHIAAEGLQLVALLFDVPVNPDPLILPLGPRNGCRFDRATYDRLVEQLGHELFPPRESATRALLEMALGFPKAVIEEMKAPTSEDPEIRRRMLAIYDIRFRPANFEYAWCKPELGQFCCVNCCRFEAEKQEEDCKKRIIPNLAGLESVPYLYCILDMEEDVTRCRAMCLWNVLASSTQYDSAGQVGATINAIGNNTGPVGAIHLFTRQSLGGTDFPPTFRLSVPTLHRLYPTLPRLYRL